MGDVYTVSQARSHMELCGVTRTAHATPTAQTTRSRIEAVDPEIELAKM